MKIAAAIATSLLIATQSSAADNPAKGTDMTVFGVALGRPLKVDECKKKPPMPYITQTFYASPTDQIDMCVQKTGSGNVLLSFPLAKDKIPLIVNAGGMPLLTVIDGNVEGVDFSTSGVESDDVVFDQLVKKYGQPSKIINGLAKNLSGAQFQTRNATWKLNGLTVGYKTVAANLLEGHVYVHTDKANSVKESERPAANSNRVNF